MAGDVSYTCETAGYFFLYQVMARWEAYISKIKPLASKVRLFLIPRETNLGSHVTQTNDLMKSEVSPDLKVVPSLSNSPRVCMPFPSSSHSPSTFPTPLNLFSRGRALSKTGT